MIVRALDFFSIQSVGAFLRSFAASPRACFSLLLHFHAWYVVNISLFLISLL
jgi:hypothetical protein